MSKPRQKPQAARAGKVANDRNKVGDGPATQKNEATRTPHSRHDREDHLGTANQPQSRRGRAGGGQR